jgi:hypothetical protein
METYRKTKHSWIRDKAAAARRYLSNALHGMFYRFSSLALFIGPVIVAKKISGAKERGDNVPVSILRRE